MMKENPTENLVTKESRDYQIPAVLNFKKNPFDTSTSESLAYDLKSNPNQIMYNLPIQRPIYSLKHLNEEEKKYHLRLQWRRNQRRRREREQQLLSNLEIVEQSLQWKLRYGKLYQDYCSQILSSSNQVILLESQNNFRIRLLQHYFSLFRHGLSFELSNACPSSSSTSPNQPVKPPSMLTNYCPYCNHYTIFTPNIQNSIFTHFVEQFMSPNIEVAEEYGPDAILRQWNVLNYVFDNLHVGNLTYEILQSGFYENDKNGYSIIRAKFQCYQLISKTTIEILFPSHLSELSERLNGKILCTQGYADYHFIGAEVHQIIVDKTYCLPLLNILDGDLRLVGNLLCKTDAFTSNGIFIRNTILDERKPPLQP